MTFASEFFSSARDLSDGDGERSRDRGLSNFDLRQNWTSNFVFSLPFEPGNKLLSGWQISGIVTVTSGAPFTIENTFDRARTGIQSGVALADRPNLRPGADNNPVLGGADRYFDTSSFELQEEGFLGDLARNSVIGPGLASFDFAVSKDTPVERFFNIFNRTNLRLPPPTNRRIFTGPSGIASESAGRLTSTVGTSRQIQFGVKLIF